MVGDQDRIGVVFACARTGPLALWILLTAVVASAHAESLDATIANALKFAHVYPDVPDDISASTAYETQMAAVERAFGTQIAGYKAGLTSTAAQHQFGVDQPVLGALPDSGRLTTPATLATVPGLKIEVEIGFLVGIDDEPAAMCAAIELPRLAYADMKQVAVADIIATDVGAYRFITGPTALLDPEVRKYPVSLERDGQQILSAFASDASGDPYDVYGWMVTRIRALGYRLEPGMILITGALGRVVDGEPGHYVARYGPLGQLEFKIEVDDHALQAPR